MGLIDATSLALMDDHKLPYIISFDSHFENVPLVVNISNLENLDFFI
jgi:predicted nucleic acid-binding protein